MTNTIHGEWQGKHPKRPIISGFFIHNRLQKKSLVEFIVDTGADRTFIVPEHQDRLDIKDSDLQGNVEMVETIGGDLPFRYLKGCSIVLYDSITKATCRFDDLIIYFADYIPSTWLQKLVRIFSMKPRPKPLVGEGEFYSVLGRDVLHQMAMACCNPQDILCITRHHQEFFEKLDCKYRKPNGEIPFEDGLDYKIIPPA